MSHKIGTLLAYESFCIESRNLYVICGDIEMDGNNELKAGMHVLIHCNSSFSIEIVIYSIEFMRKHDREYICLCFQYDDSEERDILVALNVGDETCDIHDT